MTKSAILFSEAQEFIPGGVNSPVRSFDGIGGTPVYIDHAKGAYMYDVEGKQYIDYIGSWGPMIVGHAHKDILAVINETAAKGISFGALTEIETLMAKRICQLVPSIEQVRMVSSGTEATMSAIRMARAYTQRDKIIKFEGCYHGHSDSLLVKAGSGALTLGVPSSPGVPTVVAKDTLTLSYNDSAAVKRTFAQIGEQIAAIIVEPVAGNMSCILPVAGFLETLREVCDQYASILIFDEVMTGFRVHKNCAQGLYNIKPDLTTLGKIIGGGMPVGAFGGAHKIMSSLAPVGPVYQAGTLSGNPLAMAAGYKTLELLSAVNFYQQLAEKTKILATGIQAKAVAAGIGMSVNVVGGMFGLFFSQDNPISCLAQVMRCDQEVFKQFFHGMLNEGIYLAPSAFEAGFVSAAHSDADIVATIAAAERVFDQM